MMMNPASSSGGEDDSSSSYPSSKNSPGANIVREAAGRPRRGGGRDLEPADSDDGSSVDDDDDDDDDGEGEEELGVTNFEDLPTDDSEDEDGDGDSSDGDGEGSGDEDGCDDDVEENLDREDDDDDDVPLAERVASRAGAGRRPAGRDGGDDDDRRGGAGGRGGRAERKERAIELASRRLRESRNSRRVDGASDASDPSKAGKRGDRTNSNNRPSSHDDDDDDDDDEHDDCDRDRGGPKRKKSKHAPTEVSSRRRDYFARGRPDLNSSGIGVTIGANRYRARDPRTVSLSGHLDADAFAGRYGFLDEMQEGEIETLKRRVSAWKTSGKKGQKERKRLGIVATGGGGGSTLEADTEELTRLLQERAERKRADVVRAARRTVKEKLKKGVATGKHGAYYPKRSELRKMEAEAKFEEIKKRGGDEAVDKAIAKRRKKNVAKEAKSMPSHMIR
jgi:ribosomal RNA-processing protein 36